MQPAVARGEGRGRLLFAMDATMSRQPTWDKALQIQSEMFHETARIGGLDVQLVYFRGFGECRASKWVGEPDSLARFMTSVDCRGSNTDCPCPCPYSEGGPQSADQCRGLRRRRDGGAHRRSVRQGR